MASSEYIHAELSPEEVTPHTKRLIRLIISSPSSYDDSFCQSLTLLSNVASTSSPKALWDLIYILYHSLTRENMSADDLGSLKGGDKSASVLVQKKNAALALEQVATFLPTKDQKAFLSEEHICTNADEDDEKLWLSINDFLYCNCVLLEDGKKNEYDTITQVVEKGRLLLSSNGEEYDLPLFHLYRRENLAVSQTEASIEVTGNMTHEAVEEVILSRIRLQRQILAARLGLGNLPPSVLNLESDISNQDLLGSCEPLQDDTGKNRRARKRSLSKPKIASRSKIRSRLDNKSKSETSRGDEEDQALSLPIRHLLQRALNSTVDIMSPSGSKCHPQNILATELLYQVFHPIWHVRYGALLGFLSLLRAWRRSCPFFTFGRWPHDILARSIAVLALDRFGDYSGSHFTLLGADKEDYLHIDDIAPVREIAAEVVSLLLQWAPADEVQHPCMIVLTKLARFKDHWEIRHGAMSVFRFVVKNYRRGSDIYHSCWKNIPQLAVEGLSDSSDDVKGISAQVLSSTLSLLLQEKQDNRLTLQDLITSCSVPLWESFGASNNIASSTYYLLSLLSEIINEDSLLFLQSLEIAADLATEAQIDMGLIFGRLAEYLFHSLPSVRIACLKAIANIAIPISALYQKRDVVQRKKLLASYVSVTKQLFELILTYENDDVDNFASIDFSLDYREECLSPPHGVFLRNLRLTWISIIRSFEHFLSSTGEETESDIHSMLSRLLIDLILRMTSSQVRECVHQQETVFLSDSHLHDRQIDNHDRFSNSYSASEALAHLYLSPWCRRVDFCVLGVAITSLCKCPWLDYCETSCVLLSVLSRYLISADNGDKDVISAFLDICWVEIAPMIATVPFSLSIDSVSRTRIMSERRILQQRDGIFLQTLLSMVDVGNFDDLKGLASYYSKILLDQWIGLCQRSTTLDCVDRITPETMGLDEMRTLTSFAYVLIALAPKYSLPVKLNQLIRSLMTSIKNEKNRNRRQASCEAICSLIKQLSRETRSSSVYIVRDKVVQSLCYLAIEKQPLDKSFAQGHISARIILRNLIGDPLFLNDIEPMRSLWNLIETLVETADGGNLEINRSVGIELFHVISSSIRKGTGTFQYVTIRILPSLTLTACSSVLSHDSSTSRLAIADFCKIDPITTIPLVLPKLLPSLRDFHRDTARTAGAILVKNIVDHLGVSMAPFVRILLPYIMSLMMDHVTEVAKTSAECFFCLVRIAPLAALHESVSISCCDHNGDQTDKVIEHLILGKRLPSYALPELVVASICECNFALRPYQIEGISWMAFLRSVNLNGALCDDMGLGKTLQAIVSIALAHYEAKQQRNDSESTDILASLVVCPSSLVGYWTKEISRILNHSIRTECLQYIGTAHDRKRIWDSRCCKDDFILVTSYNILRSDVHILEKLRWKYCVLDEGHLLKNPKSATAKASRSLRSNHKLILTGTPVQNNVQELWAIFDFLMPNYLGSDVEFSSRFGRDISRGQLPGASTEEIQKGLYKLRELHQQVLPFILRREKDQVLHELPPKTITRIPCEMSSVQKELYRNFISKKVTKDAIANLDRILEQTQSNDEQGMMLTFQDSDFSALHTLRLLCTHPSLIDISELTQVKSHDLSSIECSGKLLALNDLLRCSQIAPREVTGADNDVSLLYLTNVMSSSLSERNIDPEFTDDCNKEKLELYMNRSQPSRKCLIYSQFRKSLDIIESNLLKPLMPSLKYLRIDGGVDRQKRDVIVQKFNDDDDIKCLLLTSKVGSLGLNLQAASMVIFIENDWNPHSDRQAMDRAHRLGQSQRVDIYQLFLSNTIEEKILQVQDIKLRMSEALVNTENSTMYSMGTDRILDLF